jgi:hypothetical protein
MKAPFVHHDTVAEQFYCLISPGMRVPRLSMIEERTPVEPKARSEPTLFNDLNIFSAASKS